MPGTGPRPAAGPLLLRLHGYSAQQLLIKWRRADPPDPRLQPTAPWPGDGIPAHGDEAGADQAGEGGGKKCLYLVTRSLDPTGTGRTRWAMRGKPALNAFAITFSDRFPAAETY